MPTTTRIRRSLAVDDLDLARQVGTRLKAARTRAGVTQRELAEPRYTKGHISALEDGLIKPSIARALFEELLAGQAGVDTDPDLRVRTLVALAAVVTHGGDPNTAIGLLEEAKALGVDLDDRRRATLLHSLAYSHRLAGDLEVAIR